MIRMGGSQLRRTLPNRSQGMDRRWLRRLSHLKMVEASLARGETLGITRTVVLETEWVLRSRYRFDKSVVLSTFRALLEARELVFEAEEAQEHALYLFANHSADFADCLHVAGYLLLLTSGSTSS